MCALSAGVQNLIDLVDKEGANNDRYYLSAAKKRLSAAVRKLYGVSALATVPIEGWMFSCFQDDRLFLRSVGLWIDAQQAAAANADLPVGVWRAVSDLLAIPQFGPRELRSDVLDSMRQTLSYLDKHWYAQLRAGPLSLTQGDIWANMAALSRQEPPECPVMLKLHMCSTFFRADLGCALRLLQDMPCSVQLVEQGHAAGAFTRRSHLLIGEAALAHRAFLSEARIMFRRDPRETQAAALEKAFLDCLDKSNTCRLQGRHLFVQQAVAKVRSSAAAICGDIDVQAACRSVISLHGPQFSQLGWEDQCKFRDLAEQGRRAHKQACLDVAQKKHAALVAHLQTSEEARSQGSL